MWQNLERVDGFLIQYMVLRVAIRGVMKSYKVQMSVFLFLKAIVITFDRVGVSHLLEALESGCRNYSHRTILQGFPGFSFSYDKELVIYLIYFKSL